MGELFADIFSWIASLDPFWTYVALLLVAYGENVVPPIPGDMVIVFGGYLAGTSEIDFFIVWGLATLGGVLGFMTLYGVGYALGDVVYDKKRFPWLPSGNLKKAQHWIQRWGYWAVVANRFLAGTRSVISLVVGIARMHPGRTCIAASISAFAWTGLIVYAGYAIGDNWEVVSGYLKVYGTTVLILTGIAAVILFGVVRWRKKNASFRSAEKGAGEKK